MRMTLSRKRAISGYLFISPFLIGFLFMFLVAVVMAAVYSFHDMTINADGYFLTPVGFKHYINALTTHTWYIRELAESFKNMAMNVPLILMFSFFCGCLLNQKFRGRSLARVIFFLPVVMAAGIIVKIDNFSLVNEAVFHASTQSGTLSDQMSATFDISGLLQSFGLSIKVTSFLSGIVSQIYEVITDSGVQIMVILAALQSISPALMEAAQIEGATGWECFWKITFPMLSPYILTNTVYSIVDYFSSYDNGVLEVISSVASSGTMDLSYGMAMAMIYFVLAGITVGIVIFLLSKIVYYEDRR